MCEPRWTALGNGDRCTLLLHLFVSPTGPCPQSKPFGLTPAGSACSFSKRWTRDSGIKQRLRILKRLGAVTDGCPAWQESKLL